MKRLTIAGALLAMFGIGAVLLLRVDWRSSDERQLDQGTHALVKDENFDRAFQLLKPLADRGNERAMMWIGDMYAHGDGVKKDREEAMRWFRKIKDPVKRDDCPNVSVAAFLAYELSLRYKNEKKDDEAESWLNTAKTEGLDPKKCRIH